MSLISNKKFTNFKRSQRFAIGHEKMKFFKSFLCGTLKSDVQSKIISRPGFNNGLQNPMK